MSSICNFPGSPLPDGRDPHDHSNGHDQSPLRDARAGGGVGDGKWNMPPSSGKSPRHDRGRPDAAPPPEVLQLWNTPPEPPVPPGNYFADITRTYEGKTGSGKHFYALVFEICHGQYAGRCFEYRLWLTFNARTHTKACCAKFGIYHAEELYQGKLSGKLCTIFIGAKSNSTETEIKTFDPINLPACDGKGGEPCGAD